MDGNSFDIQQQLLGLLQNQAPQIFTEGKIDPAKLAATLGQDISGDKERYGLSWAGKTDCFKHIQEPTTATLKPLRKESADFDTTQNLFIEGDNLQVLKVLQKSYYGKVKMIYIDPPYNTGNDSFIYPDKFSETQDEYLKRIGDKDAEGNLIRDGFWRKNSKDAGHFHSNWLSMMYPRLFLARNLLRPDGVIFVSIDDNEVHNLKMIMNEIFGEDNFVGSIVVKKKTNGNNMGFIPPVHDYVLAYAKMASEECLLGFPISKSYIEKNYSNPDNDPRGLWTTSDLTANHKGPHFPVKNTETGKVFYPPEGRYWVFNQKEIERRIADGRIIFGKNGEGRPVQKIFLSEKTSLRRKAESWWDKHGLNEDGTKEIAELVGTKLFVHPKPSITIKHLCNITTIGNDTVLDFFAGSCTTADAVMQLNADDGGNRKFICVQLPEPCDKDSEAAKAGFATIADIGKERIRRAAKKIKKETDDRIAQYTKNPELFKDDNQQSTLDNLKSLDFGFKVFKLDESNFKEWRKTIKTPEELKKQMELFVNNVKDGTNQEDILYELILKAGLDLNVSVETKKAHGKTYYALDGGKLTLCLEEKITQGLVDKLLAEKPEKVVCLDRAFAGNDQLKTNTALQMEAEKVEFKVI